MINQHSTAAPGSLKRQPRRWPPIAGGAILALAVVGAIGVWQVRQHSTTTGSTISEGVAALGGLAEHYREAQPAPATRPTAEVMPRGGMAERYAEQAAAAPMPAVVYLVDTAERQRVLTNVGLAANEAVLVAGTPAELAAAQVHLDLLQMNIALDDNPRAVRVVDLRGQAAGSRPDRCGAGDPPPIC